MDLVSPTSTLQCNLFQNTIIELKSSNLYTFELTHLPTGSIEILPQTIYHKEALLNAYLQALVFEIEMLNNQCAAIIDYPSGIILRENLKNEQVFNKLMHKNIEMIWKNKQNFRNTWKVLNSSISGQYSFIDEFKTISDRYIKRLVRLNLIALPQLDTKWCVFQTISHV